MYLTAVAFTVSILSSDASAAKDLRGRAGFHPPKQNSSTKLLRYTDAVDIVDEERAPILEHFKTLFKSSKVTPERLQHWLDTGLPAETVFRNMKLDRENAFSLFHDPKFAKWVQYADDLKDQLRYWVAVRKDPSVFFDLLHFNWVGASIFTKPEFSVWLKYVDDVNAKHPEAAPVSIIPTLTQHLGRRGRDGTEKLLKMIESGKATYNSQAFAKQVGNELFSLWINSRETPDKILCVLKYESRTQAFMGSQRWKEWERYLNAYDSRYPEKKATTIEVLTRKYGDANLVNVLIDASAKGATEKRAAQLQAEQFDMWMSLRESPIDVYNKLQHHYRDSSFFYDPLLSTWVSYMNVFVTRNPSKVDKMFLELGDTFEDKRFFRVLERAKKLPNTKNTATRLQLEKASTVFESGKPPGEIFKLLALDNVGDDILADTLFNMWMTYLKIFNKEHPNHQESWFTTLRVNYAWSGVEIIIETGTQNPSTRGMAEKVEDAFHNYWLDSKKAPDLAFRFLYLDKAGEKTLANPKFNTWVKYLKNFNERYPEDTTTVIDGLRANYNDRQLHRTLKRAKEDSSTEELATDLQSALIHNWRDAKRTPDELKRMLDGVPTFDE
ncbi:hypothetical protein GN958_ATG18931 [Phytophthora infestans]|uniref:RxLR effector PexRD54 WY domain-containing protein n=1 Tax=Phytophthora infestans TaxID=4787 RepID=A0A8S9U161_PHYIN|nr:hypothetical protein GN958_ATG18931 [Phytophthora infestans]